MGEKYFSMFTRFKSCFMIIRYSPKDRAMEPAKIRGSPQAWAVSGSRGTRSRLYMTSNTTKQRSIISTLSIVAPRIKSRVFVFLLNEKPPF
jgi:hypothetical protein